MPSIVSQSRFPNRGMDASWHLPSLSSNDEPHDARMGQGRAPGQSQRGPNTALSTALRKRRERSPPLARGPPKRRTLSATVALTRGLRPAALAPFLAERRSRLWLGGGSACAFAVLRRLPSSCCGRCFLDVSPGGASLFRSRHDDLLDGSPLALWGRCHPVSRGEQNPCPTSSKGLLPC
jgi:hypothetical protein